PAIGAAAQRGARRGGNRDAATLLASRRHTQLRLHSQRHKFTRYRIFAVQSGIELPRLARIPDQLRWQQEARVSDLYARGILGSDGAWLFQDSRQAAPGAVPWHRRSAARGYEHLQRLVRPRAGERDGWHGS